MVIMYSQYVFDQRVQNKANISVQLFLNNSYRVAIVDARSLLVPQHKIMPIVKG